LRGLTDRVVVVAGAATGIGAATAQRLAEEGAKVIIGDLNLDGAERVAKEICARGGEAIAVRYDQCDEASIAALIDAAVSHFGALHGLHANANDTRASVLGRDGTILDVDVSVWEQTFRTNVIGYAVAVREALPHLLAAGGGAIVCTGSDSARRAGTRVAYSSSKAAVGALCRHVASTWGKEGIRCNVVSPGVVLTDTLRAVIPPPQIEEFLAEHRSRRLGAPTDIAAAVAYLLSDDATWVNGQVWSVNGGYVMRD
jgi:NAD(P)-dependent dehydrogenase (short-subunit alcohol dehydrogenase family)